MQNKLAKIEGTNFTYRFLYNSRNERIAIGKSENGSAISWRYDACNGPVCIAEFNDSADVDTYFVRGSGIAQGIGDVIAEVNYDGTSEEIHYYLYNHRGDVVCVVNPGSTPNTTYRYDAYGKCYENYGSYTSRYTFSTKEYLPEANLYLYQYRVYDPQAGRWTQRDPIDYQDSINLYQFCGNNPLSFMDILGLSTVNLHDPSSDQAKAIDKNVVEGEIVVEGHGNESMFIDSRNGKQVYLSPKELAEIIKKQPDYNEQIPIVCNNCKTGQEDYGPAAKLSEELPNKVIAPTGITITKLKINNKTKQVEATTQADINSGSYYREFRGGLTYDGYNTVNVNSVPHNATSK